MVPNPKQHSFEGTVEIIGINRCVFVPESVYAELQPSGKLPVVIEVGGNRHRTTLLPVGGRGYRVFIPKRLLNLVGADKGDLVSLTIWRDPLGWAMEIPVDVREALELIPNGEALFEKLTPAARREFIRWLDRAKTPETRGKNLRIGLERLLQAR
ncbi:MAG: YdeI/OmpD-associated family protein [Candidatus Marinimicrobia bacterium]|nr:YdeI/OmpD-associated family protein [Candidatus Neomarinimicrobiota bacterium]